MSSPVPGPAEIRTERLILRRWREDDLAPYARLSGDPQVMRYFHRTRTLEDGTAEGRWLAERFDVDGYGPWAVEAPGLTPFLGFVGCWRTRRELPFTPAVEIGWRLDKPYWGRGYAVEAAQASLADLFARTDLTEVVAYTARQNAPSRRVMEKLGMTHDPAKDFQHPAVPQDHPLATSVLYRLDRPTRPQGRPP